MDGVAPPLTSVTISCSPGSTPSQVAATHYVVYTNNWEHVKIQLVNMPGITEVILVYQTITLHSGYMSMIYRQLIRRHLH